MLKGLQPIKLASTVLFIAIVLGASNAAAETDLCEYDEAEMLALDYWDFDQHPEKGWQRFEGREECYEVAAALIRTYYESQDMHEGALRMLFFHESQLRAEIGQAEEAVNLFKQTYNPGEDTNGWNYYVDATIAFLQDDLDSLKANREKLVAVPKPENFDPRDEDGNPIDIPWPMNLHVVDSLIACFGENYKVAYSGCNVE